MKFRCCLWLCLVMLCACTQEPLPIIIDPDNPSGNADTVLISLLQNRDIAPSTYVSFKGFAIARFPNGVMMGSACNGNADCEKQITSARHPRGWYIKGIEIDREKYGSYPDSIIKWWNFGEKIPNLADNSITFSLHDRYYLVFDWGGKGGKANDTLWKFGISPIYVQRDEMLANISAKVPPAVEDYDFDGWNKDPNGTNYDNSNIELPAVLYARWTPKYLITFDANGGTNLASVRVRKDTRIPRPEIPTYSNPDILFWGWYKNANLDTLWNFQEPITNPCTLYAKWYDISDPNNMPQQFASGNIEFVLKEDLAGYYTWTKDGEESKKHYNPCPTGWNVPKIEEWNSMPASGISNLNISLNVWSSSYSDSTATPPYIHRASTRGGILSVTTIAPVRCVKYKQTP